MFEENWVREITWSSWRLCFRRRRAGLQGWRSGQSARLPPMWPGFDSRTRRHMWVEFVVGSLLCSERFFSGYSGFPLSSKTSISKFQFDPRMQGHLKRVLVTSWCSEGKQIIYTFFSFTNAPFSKTFFVHTKTKSWLFKFLRFDERIRKAPFSWRISVDGRPTLRNKAAFSISSGVAWKKETLSVTFRVRIQCYILLLVTIIAYCSDRKWQVNWLL